jgi:hypothetical protein
VSEVGFDAEGVGVLEDAPPLLDVTREGLAGGLGETVVRLSPTQHQSVGPGPL